MTLVWRPGFAYDTDASAYIDAVEAADEIASPGIGALETATRYAINDFVLGCKQDGIWNAIKASCILSGARTRTGALTPLVGAAPTSFNFVDGDYNRKTGLKGNASNKTLDSNRNRQQDPQNNTHVSVYTTEPIILANDYYFGAYVGGGGGTGLVTSSSGTNVQGWIGSTSFTNFTNTFSIYGLAGLSRSVPSGFNARVQQATNTYGLLSEPPPNTKLAFFATNQNTGGAFAVVGHSNARLAFYSIGESLDLALLDNRVSTLIAQFGAVIP